MRDPTLEQLNDLECRVRHVLHDIWILRVVQATCDLDEAQRGKIDEQVEALGDALNKLFIDIAAIKKRRSLWGRIRSWFR